MNGKERIVAALNRQPVDRTPVWFMRQAGRHLPEYRKLAAEHSFWERCQDLDLCTTITMQPIHRYGSIDAAIVFSDILTPLPALWAMMSSTVAVFVLTRFRSTKSTIGRLLGSPACTVGG